MKKVIKHITLAVCTLAATSGFAIHRDRLPPVYPHLSQDITGNLPEISTVASKNFDKVPDVAQYKEADWNNVVGIAKGISIEEAYKIAEESPDISFFFYTKGGQMVLEKPSGEYRVFHHGDTVFFSGEPWWGTAPGLADGFVKKTK